MVTTPPPLSLFSQEEELPLELLIQICEDETIIERLGLLRCLSKTWRLFIDETLPLFLGAQINSLNTSLSIVFESQSLLNYYFNTNQQQNTHIQSITRNALLASGRKFDPHLFFFEKDKPLFTPTLFDLIKHQRHDLIKLLFDQYQVNIPCHILESACYLFIPPSSPNISIILSLIKQLKKDRKKHESEPRPFYEFKRFTDQMFSFFPSRNSLKNYLNNEALSHLFQNELQKYYIAAETFKDFFDLLPFDHVFETKEQLQVLINVFLHANILSRIFELKQRIKKLLHLLFNFSVHSLIIEDNENNGVTLIKIQNMIDYINNSMIIQLFNQNSNNYSLLTKEFTKVFVTFCYKKHHLTFLVEHYPIVLINQFVSKVPVTLDHYTNCLAQITHDKPETLDLFLVAVLITGEMEIFSKFLNDHKLGFVELYEKFIANYFKLSKQPPSFKTIKLLYDHYHEMFKNPCNFGKVSISSCFLSFKTHLQLLHRYLTTSPTDKKLRFLIFYTVVFNKLLDALEEDRKHVDLLSYFRKRFRDHVMIFYNHKQIKMAANYFTLYASACFLSGDLSFSLIKNQARYDPKHVFSWQRFDHYLTECPLEWGSLQKLCRWFAPYFYGYERKKLVLLLLQACIRLERVSEFKTLFPHGFRIPKCKEIDQLKDSLCIFFKNN